MYMAGECVAAAAGSELLEAADGEGRTVNRDWSNKHRGRFSPGEILLVFGCNISNKLFYITVNKKSVSLRH